MVHTFILNILNINYVVYNIIGRELAKSSSPPDG